MCCSITNMLDITKKSLPAEIEMGKHSCIIQMNKELKKILNGPLPPRIWSIQLTLIFCLF